MAEALEKLWMPTNAIDFNPTSPRYRIFGCCHVKLITQIYCWLGIISSFGLVVFIFPYELGYSVVNMVISGLSLYGLKTNRPDFVFVLLVSSILECVAETLGLTCYYFYEISAFEEKTIPLLITLFVMTSYIALMAFFIVAIYRCYEYICGMKMAKENQLPVTV